MVSRPEEGPAGKRLPFSPEHGVDQVRLTDSRISPDGLSVAYVVTPVARQDEHGTSEIWRVPFEGGEARRLTRGPRADAAPRWSPDGTRLAFTSDREKPGQSQLYVMSTRGGEAVRLTDRHSRVSDPEWSPDGRWIAFLSPDEETEAEEKDEKERRDQIVAGANVKRNRLYLIRPEGGTPFLLSPDGPVNVWDYCWSPDGARIAIVTTPTPKLNDYRVPHPVLVAAVPAQPSGEPASEPAPVDWRELFRFDSDVKRPAWSPDGRRLAFLGCEGRIVSGDALHVASTDTGEVQLLTPGYAGSVLCPQWDGDRIVFSALENMYGAINAVDLDDRSIRPLLPKSQRCEGTFGVDLALGPRGRFAVVRSRMAEPPQLFCGILGGEIRAVTTANETLQGVELRPAEAVNWRSPDGKIIHGLLVTPGRSTSGPHPTILAIHGGPASAFSDRFMGGWHDWAQLLAAAGFAVFMPNPRGSTGRGAAFTQANVRDLGGFELRDNMAGLDHLVDLGIADPARLGVGGWSHGGYMTAWTVTQTNRFKAALMGAGLSNLVSDQGTNDIPAFNLDYFYRDYAELYDDPSLLWERSPLKHVRQVKTPTLILHGEKDERVSAAQGREFYQALKSLGVRCEMVVYPREPHGFREREHQLDLQRRIVEWFKRYV